MTLTEFLLARIGEDEAAFAVGNYIPAMRDRLLAECEAKRRIVGQVIDLDLFDGYTEATRDAVRTLAAVYRDHPEYRAEWSE